MDLQNCNTLTTGMGKVSIEDLWERGKVCSISVLTETPLAENRRVIIELNGNCNLTIETESVLIISN